MTRITRLIGLAGCLLLFFFAAVLLSQSWLGQQTDKIHEASLRAREIQLEAILALSRAGPPPWSDPFTQGLEQAIDAQIKILPAGTKTIDLVGPRWQFDHPLPGEQGQPPMVIRVAFSAPPVVQLVALYQRLTATLLVLALALLLGFVGVAALGGRTPPVRDQDAPRSTSLPSARAEMSSLARLAEVSVQQGEALQRERTERLRAEEDLHFQQVLLNRSLEEKIRLGRDLHDGVIQALYATGLTLEAAKNLLDQNPAEARRQLEFSMSTLNTTIRDVRGYIVGLSPQSLREESFAESIRSLTQTLNAGREVNYDLKIENESTIQLTEAQTADLIQVVREAISNALRHGAATMVKIRLHAIDRELCLLVQDNGTGFDAQRPPKRGHGLSNMKARATRLKADMRYTRPPEGGTRFTLTLPIAAQFGSRSPLVPHD
jgi:signal transduction histidine kinase